MSVRFLLAASALALVAGAMPAMAREGSTGRMVEKMRDPATQQTMAAAVAALSEAILRVRRRGGIVVMVTHRPATLGPVSHIAVLSAGRLIDYGERDEVLKRTAKVELAGTNDAPAHASEEALR